MRYECKVTLNVSMSMVLEADSWSAAHAMLLDLAKRCEVKPPNPR